MIAIRLYTYKSTSDGDLHGDRTLGALDRKILQCSNVQISDSVSKTLHPPLRVTTSKVSILDLQCPTDVSRCGFNSSVSTLGSMGLPGTIQMVSGSLRGMPVSQASCFVFSSCTDICRYEFDSSVSPSASNDLVRTL